jgi:hypothetical protein
MCSLELNGPGGTCNINCCWPGGTCNGNCCLPGGTCNRNYCRPGGTCNTFQILQPVSVPLFNIDNFPALSPVSYASNILSLFGKHAL